MENSLKSTRLRLEKPGENFYNGRHEDIVLCQYFQVKPPDWDCLILVTSNLYFFGVWQAEYKFEPHGEIIHSTADRNFHW